MSYEKNAPTTWARAVSISPQVKANHVILTREDLEYPAFDPYTFGRPLFMMKTPKFMEEPAFAEATQKFIQQFKADQEATQ